MEHTFTLDEARRVLAEIREPLDEVVEIRAELASRAHAHRRRDPVQGGPATAVGRRAVLRPR